VPQSLPVHQGSVAAQAPAGPPQVDSSEELLAFVSLARLTSRTPMLADVGALAWSHLRHLAPGASLALFTVDQARRALVAEYCAGSAADRLAGTSMMVGQRVSGWVAANVRTMVNADAQLDLARDDRDLRVAMAMPLVADGTVVGVMTLYGPDGFAEDCSRSIEMIAPHLAVAVASVVSARTGIPSSVFAHAAAPARGHARSQLARARA
jgi:hypothetical protein